MSMTWVIGLKFFHYLSLFLAGGLGVANAMLVKAHQKAEMPPTPPVQQTMKKLARLGLLALVFAFSSGANAETWIMVEGTFGNEHEVIGMGGNFKKTYPSGEVCLSKQLEGITNDPNRMNSSGSNFNVLKSVVNGKINTNEYTEAFILNGTRGYLEYPGFRACIRIE